MADDSGTSIKVYLQEISGTPLLTVQEEIELAARIKNGDQKARAWMIKANLRLVVKIAHDYSNLGLPLLDLISEGNIGLIKAVERFDPGKGGKLSTYSSWWIKQSIRRALANQSKTIRLPVHLVDKIWKMRRVSLQMSEELGREPTDEEFAEEIGISSAKLSQLKTVSIRPASLDAPISDDNSTEFGEIVGDEDAQTPFELFRDKNMRDELGELLEVLDDRERKIIFKRFGLDGGEPNTLEEVLRSNCWKERFVVTDFLNNPLVWLEAELAYHTYRTRGAAQDVGNRIDRMIRDGKKTDMEMYGCWKLGISAPQTFGALRSSIGVGL
jgi:RNA polymerase primary sigma factor